jgi:hypothetical protein
MAAPILTVRTIFQGRLLGGVSPFDTKDRSVPETAAPASRTLAQLVGMTYAKSRTKAFHDPILSLLVVQPLQMAGLTFQ